MTWYVKSLGVHDTHLGHLRRGRVIARCGIEFGALGPGLRDQPDDGQLCAGCVQVGAARWARSPLDWHAHLVRVEGGEHPAGALHARCGLVLPTGVTQYDERPGGLVCERCWLIFLEVCGPGLR